MRKAHARLLALLTGDCIYVCPCSSTVHKYTHTHMPLCPFLASFKSLDCCNRSGLGICFPHQFQLRSCPSEQ
ncbi:hypothetical protein I7I48_10773 [Histoplasma ohiense]|nr:hypothetical protein I7I48_10773 [Histoplasma ohiense (nom. inval.)]